MAGIHGLFPLNPCAAEVNLPMLGVRVRSLSQSDTRHAETM